MQLTCIFMIFKDVDMDAVEENEDVEEESAELEVGVSIQGLKKTFSVTIGHIV